MRIAGKLNRLGSRSNPSILARREIKDKYTYRFDAICKFSDTIPGAESMAILYSLAETAKANNADVRLYFQYLLEKIPPYQDLNGAITDDKVLETLTPWSDAYRRYEKEQKQSAAERFQMMFPQPIRPKTPKKRAEKIA